MLNVLRTIFVGIGAFVSMAGISAADTQLDVVYANGTKRCTITSASAPAVKLVTEGPNAGHLVMVTDVPSPFSGDCPGGQTGGGITVSPVTGPNSVQQNTPFTVQFTTTGSPDYCTSEGSVIPPNSSVAGWQPVSNTTQVCTGGACASVAKTLTATGTGEHQFAVKCYKANVAAVSSPTPATVSVTTPDGQCPTPQVATRALTASVIHSNFGASTADARYYKTIFGYLPGTGVAHEFPEPPLGSQVNIALGANEYFAFEFTVPTTGLQPNFLFSLATFETRWQPPVGNFNPAPQPIGIAISRCPGVFKDPEISSTCRGNLSPNSEMLFLALRNNSAPQYACQLEPGARYYMNFVFANVDTPGVPLCPDFTCRFSMKTHRDRGRPGN
ncbi:hypothetical protein [Tahibacter amnicola]|uniref:Ig-like domain-containing protein n=1 Tax=Tahibacter amnicola TaxID=2976241 RepID=A0ABY6BAC0_9GAMM|nr:hypothetical protein [Tahibacter amnicola]UXI67011.1 hypothetical protein N4264_19990 [Tahibacter amnicola]